MTALESHETVWRGHIPVAGYWVPASDLTRKALSLLSKWRPGARLVAVGDGVAMLFVDASLREDVSKSIAAPLVLIDGAWSACPLSPTERTVLSVAPGCVVLVRGGSAQIYAPTQQTPLVAEEWIDTSSSALADVESLGHIVEPIAAPVILEQPLSAVLPGAPLSTEAATRMAHALRNQQALERQSTTTHDGAATSQPVGLLATFFVDLFVTFRGVFKHATRKPTSLTARRPFAFIQAISHLVRTWIARSALGRHIGRSQLRYLEQLVGMFERGDFENALRHAIPLDSRTQETLTTPLLGRPTARRDLAIQGRRPEGRSYMFGTTLFHSMKEQYRRAFTQMDRAERIDEAAFILAELLDAPEEAVAYLEQKQRLRQAAMVAETKDLAPGLRIRQWLLAGDKERAMELAIRHGAFADAIVRLERTHANLAVRLRQLWAQERASAGDLVMAVEALWPEPSLQRESVTWLDWLIDRDDEPSPRMLARRISLDETLADDGPLLRRARTLLLAGPQEAQRRASFAKALLDVPASEGVKVAAREACRSALADALLTGKEIERLARLGNDLAFSADLPPAADKRLPSRPSGLSTTMNLRIDASDRGSQRVYDAYYFGEHRILTALGEAGARVMGARGQTRAYFDCPATHLVVADHGGRALALAQRNDVWSITSLNLVDNRCDAWTNLRLNAYVPHYDGRHWWTAYGGRLALIDTLAPVPVEFWSVDNAPGLATRISADATHMSALYVREADPSEAWTFDVGHGPILRKRSPVDFPLEMACVALTPVGAALYCLRKDDGRWVLQIGDSSTLVDLGHCDEARFASASASHCVTILRVQGGSTALCINLRNGRVVLRLELEGSERAGGRLVNDKAVFYDELGRVVVFQTETACILTNRRVN